MMVLFDSDPTMQSPTALGQDTADAYLVSLSEIEAMGRKAARGAGYEWGVAEEAGKAARWLTAHEFPGPETLLSLLRVTDGQVKAHNALTTGETCRAKSGELCSLQLGAVLSDIAPEIVMGRVIRTQPVLVPLLLVPSLCRAASDLNVGFSVAMSNTQINIGPEGLECPGEHLPHDGTAELVIQRRALNKIPIAKTIATSRTVSHDVWRGLDQFSARTYVPVSEASRTTGAGAGVLDND